MKSGGLPATLSLFMRESSMHGLRYLVEAKNPVVRALWFASICFCVSSATAIIYLNVVNWNNTPAVVTSVHPDLAKGKMFMPMVSVCPRYPDFYVLLHKLLKRYPDYVREERLLERLGGMLVEQKVKDEMHARAVSRYATYRAETFFDSCMHADAEGAGQGEGEGEGGSGDLETEECQFALLLSEMADFLRFSYDKWHLGVRDYVYRISASREAPTLASLQRHYEEHYGVTVDEERRMPTSVYSYHYDTLIELYALFLPVFVDEEQRELDVLRPISAFRAPDLPTAGLSDEDFPSLVAYLVDRNVLYAQDQSEGAVEDISWLLAGALFDLIGRFVGVDPADVEQVLNALAYDPFDYPVFGDINKHDPPYTNPCEHLLASPTSTGSVNASADASATLPAADIWEACEAATTSSGGQEAGNMTDPLCAWYCRAVVGNDTLQQKVKELLEEASYLTTGLQPGYPQVLLPICRYSVLHGDMPPGQCWRRIINDKGICYSAQTDGLKKQIGDHGPQHGYEMTIDVGGKYYINKFLANLTGAEGHGTWQQTFELMVTPPNHFAIGRLMEEEKAMMKYDAGEARLIWLVKVKLDYIAEGTAEFRAMDPGKRNCLYPDERALDHFDVYSEPNCVLQCAWDHARRECGCEPWFLLGRLSSSSGSSSGGARMCEANGNRCFRRVVGGRYDINSSDCISGCLPDCETVQYEIERQEKALTVDGGLYTGDLKTGDNEIYYDYVIETKASNVKQDILDVIDPLMPEGQLDNVGLVKVYIDKKSTLKIVLTATVTIIDMISNIGGTLGLFCGVSILSMAEIIYWAGRFITKKRI